MSRRNLSQEQINELLKNKNVVKCSSQSITYSKDFKIWAVRQYRDEGLYPKQIFVKAGFDPGMIGKEAVKSRIKEWNRIFRKKGAGGLAVENRGKGGGRPRTKNLTDEEKIKRLELTVEYLNAENDFLAKLRGLKRERNLGQIRNSR